MNSNKTNIAKQVLDGFRERIIQDNRMHPAMGAAAGAIAGYGGAALIDNITGADPEGDGSFMEPLLQGAGITLGAMYGPQLIGKAMTARKGMAKAKQGRQDLMDQMATPPMGSSRIEMTPPVVEPSNILIPGTGPLEIPPRKKIIIR